VESGDFNGDNIQDVAVLTRPGECFVSLNDGVGGFLGYHLAQRGFIPRKASYSFLVE